MSEKKSATVAGPLLRSFLERIERIREEKKLLADDEKQIFAEANANGFDTKTIRKVLALRKQKPNDREEQEALLDTYLHAIGMAKDTPLFTAVGRMSVDIAAREQVIEAFMHFVPAGGGEIVVKMGGAAIRLWRDDDGDPHAEDYVEAERKRAREGAAADPIDGHGEPKTYKPRHAPRLPSLSAIKEIADRAEAASKSATGAAKRGDVPSA